MHVGSMDVINYQRICIAESKWYYDREKYVIHSMYMLNENYMKGA